ncbi:asparagine synthetase B [Granulicella sp. S156]|uniref:asparagine synthetase B family protein n=1 Tax=Granulicella sp. S156 TaxID=1747224 RepID=UPI00131C2DDD|nr:asparagine synthase-related protein [Granulicella sp. S156]
MSIIFGIRKPLGASAREEELLHLANATERYALDGVTVQVEGRVGMGFQPCHTHLRSELESGPASDAQGNLLVVDGRIDNYRDLCRELELDEVYTADSQLILAAYRQWDEACFSRFVGDWALALWSTRDQVLYLARDHAGARTLYFENKKGTLRWSTYLDSFFTDPRSLDVDQDYVACYLAAQPLRDLTPHNGIRAILPAHYVAARERTLHQKPHWQWVSKAKTRYQSDQDYEDHFFELFRQSVERRTGPGTPILAQLSGGMDSSSIVCMSDHIRRSQNQSTELLDTISFYDDAEPNWNEKPYFSTVEAKRGKAGTHVRVSSLQQTFELPGAEAGMQLLPGLDHSRFEREKGIYEATSHQGYRSILSGIGGDEVLGGIPTPLPELADHLVSGELGRLLERTTRWCLIDRSPLLHTLYATANYAFSLYRSPQLDQESVPPWIQDPLRRACRSAGREQFRSGHDRTSSPTAIANGLAWWSIMETLPHIFPASLTRLEYRYPFLDKQLVDYLFSIPREQLVRPGRRRSLMRRALAGIVPTEILERRRKAYLIRGPLSALRGTQSKISSLFDSSHIGDRGFVFVPKLQASLEEIAAGRDLRWVHALMRAIAFELWLQGRDGTHPLSPARPTGLSTFAPEQGADKIRMFRVAG